MKGHEHFREAERLLAEGFREDAQVHAILSASVALSNIVKLLAEIDREPEQDAEPAHAEPLVTCGYKRSDGQTCVLPVDHDEGNLHHDGNFSFVGDTIVRPYMAEAEVTA